MAIPGISGIRESFPETADAGSGCLLIERDGCFAQFCEQLILAVYECVTECQIHFFEIDPQLCCLGTTLVLDSVSVDQS